MVPQCSRQQQSLKKGKQFNSSTSTTVLKPNMKTSKETIRSIGFVWIVLTTTTTIFVNANTMFCRCSNPRKLENSNTFNYNSNNNRHRTLSDNRNLFDRQHNTSEDDDDININENNDENNKSIFTRAALESVSGPIIDSLKPKESYDVVDGVTILPFNHAACKRGIARPSKSKPQRRLQQSISSSKRRTQKLLDTAISSTSSSSLLGIQQHDELQAAARRDAIISSNSTVMMMNAASNLKLKLSKLFVEFENETETTLINTTNNIKLKLDQLFKTTTKNDTSKVLNGPKNNSTSNFVGGYVKSIWDLFAITKENTTNIDSVRQNNYTITDSNTTSTKLGTSSNPTVATLHQNGYSISESNTRIDTRDSDKIVPESVQNSFSVSTSSMAKLQKSPPDTDSFIAKLKFMKDRRQASNYINWDEKRYEFRKKMLEIKTRQTENKINIFLAKLKSMNVAINDVAVTKQKKKLRNRFKQEIADLGPKPSTPLRTLRPRAPIGSPITRRPRTSPPTQPITTVPDDDDDNYNNDIGTFICPPDVKVTGRPITTRATSIPTRQPRARKPRKRSTRKPRIPTKTPTTTRKPITSKPIIIPTLVPTKMFSDVPSGPILYNSQSPNTVGSDVPSLSPETINNIDSAVPTMIPSATSTRVPSVVASSVKPSVVSSDNPSSTPSFQNSGSDRPSTAPTMNGSDDSPQSSSSIQPQISSSDAPSVAPMFSQQPSSLTQLTDIPSRTGSVRPSTLTDTPTIFDSSNIPSYVPAGSSSSQPTSMDDRPSEMPSVPTLSQVPSVTDVSNIPSTIPQTTQSQNPTTTIAPGTNIPTSTSILSDIPTSVGSGVPVSRSSIPSSTSFSNAPLSTNLSITPSSVPITTQSQNPSSTSNAPTSLDVSNTPSSTPDQGSVVPVPGSNSPSSTDSSKAPTLSDVSNIPSSTPDQGSVDPASGSNNPSSTDSSNAPMLLDVSNMPSSTPGQGSVVPALGSSSPSSTDKSNAPTSLDLSTIPSFVPSKRDISQVPYISFSPSKTDVSQVPVASLSPITSSVVPSVSPTAVGSNVPSNSPVLVDITLAPTAVVSSLTLEPSTQDISIAPSRKPSTDSQSESPSSTPSYTGPFSGIRYPTSSPVPSWPLANIPMTTPAGLASIQPSFGPSASLKPTSTSFFPTTTLVPIIAPTVSNTDSPSVLSSDFPSTSPNILIPTTKVPIQSNPVAPTNRLLLKEKSTDTSNISESFRFTHSISSSSNRAVVVVGLRKDSQGRKNSGILHFYRLNDLTYELIKSIAGQPDDILGHQVAVCSDGGTVVAAASSSIHIYQVDSQGKWIETQRLVQKSRLHFVSNLVLSTDCTKLVVSEYNIYDRESKNGKVHVYSRINNIWEKLGSEILVDASAGAEIPLAIAAAGTMLAVATTVTRGMTAVIVALVYELNDQNKWEHLGNEIPILSIGKIKSSPGTSNILTMLALSDGRNLAVSSYVGHGQVKIYVLIDDVWTIQDVIKGNNIQGWFGASLKFTEENNKLHVGVVNDGSSNGVSDGSLQEVDSIHIYKNVLDKWIKTLDDSEISDLGELPSAAANYREVR